MKRHKAAGRGDVGRWWLQTVEQATDALPVLFFRLDRDAWRAVWPLATCLTEQTADHWRGYRWTVEGSPEAWAALAREHAAAEDAVLLAAKGSA